MLTIAVALRLIGFGYVAGHPAPPSAQNQILTGILLGTFAIIPNRTNELPVAWRKYYAAKHNGKRID